jgi:hypothetical protein
VSGRYILGPDGAPVPEPDLLTWARWYETADRTLARHEGGGGMVSTVFLGLDHAWGGGKPVLWETLVFGGPLDGEMRRYTSKKDAARGHAEMVARVRAAQAGNPAEGD